MRRMLLALKSAIGVGHRPDPDVAQKHTAVLGAAAAERIRAGYDGSSKPLERARRDALQSDGAGNHVPFLTPEEMSVARDIRRVRNIERAKQILKIVHLVQQHSVAEELDSFVDLHAEEFAVHLFGKL